MPTAAAEIIIDAPATLVWRTILALEHYPDWNPFTPRIDCPGGPHVGAPIDIHVRWSNGKGLISRERIGRLEPLGAGGDGILRGVYGYNFGGPLAALGLVRSERLQIVEQLADRRTQYSTTIRLWGLLAGATPLQLIQDGFDRQTAALKRRCEELQAGQKAPLP